MIRIITTILFLLLLPSTAFAETPLINPVTFTIEDMDSHPSNVTISNPSKKSILNIVNCNPEVAQFTYDKISQTFNFTYKETVNHLSGLSNYDLPKEQKEFLKSIKNKSDFIKINAIYTWIRNNCDYDQEFINDPTATRASDEANAIGVFNGSAVCLGYADAFYLLSNLSGINCYMTSNIKHAWNIVELNNKWYFIDATNGHFLVGLNFLNRIYDLEPCYYHNKKIELENYSQY